MHMRSCVGVCADVHARRMVVSKRFPCYRCPRAFCRGARAGALVLVCVCVCALRLVVCGRYSATDLLGTSFIKSAKPAKLQELLATVPDVGTMGADEPAAPRLTHLPSDECVPRCTLRACCAVTTAVTGGRPCTRLRSVYAHTGLEGSLCVFAVPGVPDGVFDPTHPPLTSPRHQPPLASLPCPLPLVPVHAVRRVRCVPCSAPRAPGVDSSPAKAETFVRGGVMRPHCWACTSLLSAALLDRLACCECVLRSCFGWTGCCLRRHDVVLPRHGDGDRGRRRRRILGPLHRCC
jgi:hypothetical protein